MFILNPMRLKFFLIFILLAYLPINISADVFQWTDENGQTHFSDRAPNKIQANNISEQLNNINLASDLSSPEMMLRHEQAKDAEREKRHKEQQDYYKNKPTKSELCKEAQKLLKVVKGRVVFIDEQGKDLKISEKTRKQRAAQLENEVRKHCQ